MKSAKPICTLLIAAMCSCTNSTAPARGEQQEATDTVQQTAVLQPEKVYKELTHEPGVVFYDITLEEALEKSKKESKYVLIDCHTKTCGPCRKMEKGVFPQEKLGKFMNERFVPVMMDMEEGEGLKVAEKYNIQIFPTMLVLLPNGAKEGEIVGAEFDIDSLIGMLKTIIHEE
ncbi:MAG: thioredoxin family protein [Bacteroidaceae bacterium]|nr:thioredoxin family protein [Bacteroidaceae bacterium]